MLHAADLSARQSSSHHSVVGSQTQRMLHQWLLPIGPWVCLRTDESLHSHWLSPQPRKRTRRTLCLIHKLYVTSALASHETSMGHRWHLFQFLWASHWISWQPIIVSHYVSMCQASSIVSAWLDEYCNLERWQLPTIDDMAGFCCQFLSEITVRKCLLLQCLFQDCTVSRNGNLPQKTCKHNLIDVLARFTHCQCTDRSW